MLHFALLGRNGHIWMVAASAGHRYLSLGILGGQYKLKASVASEDLVGQETGQANRDVNAYLLK